MGHRGSHKDPFAWAAELRIFPTSAGVAPAAATPVSPNVIAEKVFMIRILVGVCLSVFAMQLRLAVRVSGRWAPNCGTERVDRNGHTRNETAEFLGYSRWPSDHRLISDHVFMSKG
jgi:hypothetical protein